MEKRREPRLDTTGPARITVLGEHERRVQGQALNVSGHGLKLLLQESLPAGTALMVEWADTQLLGEVCYCQPDENGFAVGVQVEHAVLGTNELARLARKLLGQPEPEPVRIEVHGEAPKP